MDGYMWFRRSPEQKTSLANKLVLLFLFASIYPFSLVTYMGWRAMAEVSRRNVALELKALARSGESALVAQLKARRAALVDSAARLERGEVPEVLRVRLGAESLEVVSRPTEPRRAAAFKFEGRSLEASAPMEGGRLLVARWPLQELGRLWGSSGRAETMMVGPAGVVAASSGGRYPLRAIPPESLRRLRDGSKAEEAYMSSSGLASLGAASGGELSELMAGEPWMVVAEAPAALGLGPADELRMRFMRFGLVMVVLFTAIAGLFAHTIMRPIAKLAEGSRKIAGGDLDHRLEVETGDELELLAREFNSMAAKLKDSYASLEKKIARATADLRYHADRLAEERDRVDGILKSVADPLLVTDRRGRLVLANPAAEAAFGFWLGEVGGRMVGDVLRSGPVRAAVEGLLALKESGASKEVEFTPAGGAEPRSFLVQTALVQPAGGGEPLGVVTTFSDVTPFRELDRAKSEFLSMASHELRTPLTSIQGFSEILLTRELAEEEAARFLGYINSQARKLGGMIGDLLDVARIEAGRGLELEPEPVEIGPLVSGCLEVFRSRGLSHSFLEEVAGGLPPVVADRGKLEQVLGNLLANAVKYSPDGGAIRVRAERRGGSLVIEVSDKGRGMSPEQVARVFDKFYRAEGSAGAVEGTGLGMFIVKSIVEAHGGLVWLESEPGRGTTVSVALPCPEADGEGAPPATTRRELVSRTV